jgi:hypothetical protein
MNFAGRSRAGLLFSDLSAVAQRAEHDIYRFSYTSWCLFALAVR